MSEEDVQISAVEDPKKHHFGYQSENPPKHLEFCKLMLTPVVAPAASETGNNQIVLFISDDFAVDADSSEPGMMPLLPILVRERIRRRAKERKILEIVIAENEVQRFVQTGHDVFVVADIQIARTEYEVDASEPLSDV